jgi:hypothetical protein
LQVNALSQCLLPSSSSSATQLETLVGYTHKNNSNFQ